MLRGPDNLVPTNLWVLRIRVAALGEGGPAKGDPSGARVILRILQQYNNTTIQQSKYALPPSKHTVDGQKTTLDRRIRGYSSTASGGGVLQGLDSCIVVPLQAKSTAPSSAFES
jgi:hypothetical protein